MVKITKDAEKFINQEIKKENGDCVVFKKTNSGKVFYFYDDKHKVFDRGMTIECSGFTLIYDFFDDAVVDLKGNDLIITIK